MILLVAFFFFKIIYSHFRIVTRVLKFTGCVLFWCSGVVFSVLRVNNITLFFNEVFSDSPTYSMCSLLCSGVVFSVL